MSMERPLCALIETMIDLIRLMEEESELLADTLGEHVFDFFLRNKRAEWNSYSREVTQFERDTMLPVL